MKLWIRVFLIGIAVFSQNGNARAESKTIDDSKTVTIEIPSDRLPPPSAEKEVPLHPFFSESTGNEAMEKIQELNDRVSKLEDLVRELKEEKR